MENFSSIIPCNSIKNTLLHKKVHLAGWVHRRRDHGGLVFIDLRDRTGLVQLVFNPDFSPHAFQEAQQLRSEYVIFVVGTVVDRAPEAVNKAIETGAWEVQISEISVLSRSKVLPFTLDEAAQVDEELRLKYRYLDLRRPAMHHNFALRHRVIFAMREFLNHEGFYEIETPILTKNTPEGSREFLVPSRIHHGFVYSLPQSPQLYKQLLMAAGMQKYFQVARCFRDEDLRADRQPEFTQLDLEMSFVQEHDIQSVIERLLAYIWKKIFNQDLAYPFDRMTYDQAFASYGSDKPDVRFELPIVDITQAFEGTELKFLRSVLESQGKIGALHVAGQQFSRSELDQQVVKAQKLGARGLLWIRVVNDENFESPVSKFLPKDFAARMKKIIPEFGPDSILFINAGEYKESWSLLGKLRLELAQQLALIPNNSFKFTWITDFPLFEYDKEHKKWSAAHHPFTQPQQGWEHKEQADMKARAYDIVLNGIELGGGSIRIHNSEMQEKIFTFIGLSAQQAHEQFGFLLEAQNLGFPPHGGIALGVDRLIMLLAQEHSIREVIAFPKTARGYDPLTQAPTKISVGQLREYNLTLLPTRTANTPKT
jgi:aspartyl-tRNA synthetase